MTLPSTSRASQAQDWCEGQVIGRHAWSPSLVTLRIAAEIEPSTAGQFVNLGLMLDGEFLSRPYSIASAPGEALEFYLSTAGSSALTLALLRLQIGDRLHVARKPQGLFTLARVPSCRSLWMVATGTGLGPFIAMLRTEEPWQRAERIVLVHGAREVAHLSYAEELERISAAHEHRFTRVPILSRESAEGGILNGRVTSAIFDGTLEQRAGVPLAPEDSQVMLCGNPAMVEEMLRVLEQRGLRLHSPHGPGHVTIEK